MSDSIDVDFYISFAKQHILSAILDIRRKKGEEEVIFQLDKALDQLSKLQRTKWYAEQTEMEVEVEQKRRKWWLW